MATAVFGSVPTHDATSILFGDAMGFTASEDEVDVGPDAHSADADAEHQAVSYEPSEQVLTASTALVCVPQHELREGWCQPCGDGFDLMMKLGFTCRDPFYPLHKKHGCAASSVNSGYAYQQTSTDPHTDTNLSIRIGTSSNWADVE